MKSKLLLLALLGLFNSVGINAQPGKKIKFGEIQAADFTPTSYSIDSNANAVILADIGSSKIEGNNKGWFSLIYKRFERIHILNKNGFDIADFSISLYDNGDQEEKLDKLKAVTYNLENGKIVETRLDVKSQVFKEKISDKWTVRKFTLPNLRAGSIIEVEYTIESDFLNNLQPWEFQGEYPRLWSEYNLTVPNFLGYIFLKQGYTPYTVNETKERMESFRIIESRGTSASERYDFRTEVMDYRWVMENVPALKEESFTSTIDNHISKIEFQLAEFRSPLQYKSILGTWTNVAQELMKAEYFGGLIDNDNGWMKDIIKPLTAGLTTVEERAKKIYNYVRDNYACNNHNRRTMDQNLRSIAKNKKGNVAEINLLLTAFLKYDGFLADPVILSTRDNGFCYPLYPITDQFNYVISRVIVNGRPVYLDASESDLGFGRLPLRCYNGHARVINNMAEAITLPADSITERKMTTVFIINDEKGKLIGSIQQTPGYYESMRIRSTIKEKGLDKWVKDVVTDLGEDFKITNPKIDSLDKPDHELHVSYDFDFPEENPDIIYFNPILGEAYKENPFKAAERIYPVEMPYTVDQIYNLQLEIPKGYTIDELPQQVMVKLNENEDGIFEYRISKSQENISLRTRIQFKRALYSPEEYESLREFFNLIVKKQAEQIVFKKKK